MPTQAVKGSSEDSMIEKTSIHSMPGVTPSEPADEEALLVRQIILGDRIAFEVLMRRYNRLLFRLARSVLGDDAEAEDALQEVYLRAHQTIAGFRGTLDCRRGCPGWSLTNLSADCESPRAVRA